MMVTSTRKPVNYKVFNSETVGASSFDKSKRIAQTGDIPAIDSANVLLLQRANNYWNGLSDWRKRRERNRRYYRGDQWGDQVFDPDTQTYMSEEDLIKAHGRVPLKQNQIRQLIKNLLGQYHTDTTKTAVVSHKRADASIAEMLTNTIQYGLQINRAKELDARNFEEFMISGAAMWRTSFRFINKFQREDVWTENAIITNAFWSPNIRDIRMTDMDFIGIFYDMYVKDIVSKFAATPAQEARIEEIFSNVIPPDHSVGQGGVSLSAYYANNVDFYVSKEPDKGRVFEVWERKAGWRLLCHDWLNARAFVSESKDKKIIDSENMQRLADAAAQGVDPKMVPLITYKERFVEFWHVKYLSWQGHVLMESETPYDHKEHPFTLLLYPLVDGEVWGFVEDVIDQQRYINRLVTMLDFIIGSSAKGVLLVPEDSIAPDFDINQIADEWTKFNGVIKIKLKPGGQVPQQISANSSNIGIHELLSLQLRFMSEISGVSGPIQGQKADSGTPASLYAQETQNSTLNSKDYFEAFNAAKTERDWKMLKVQIQYYDDDRTLALSGASYTDESLVFNKQRAEEVEFDMVMAKSPDSPVYRNLLETSLKEFVLSNFIDFKTYLKNSSLPFADNLLNDIQVKEKMMMEAASAGGGIPSMVDPAMSGQVTQYLQSQGADANKANPKTMEMLNRYMKGFDNLN